MENGENLGIKVRNWTVSPSRLLLNIRRSSRWDPNVYRVSPPESTTLGSDLFWEKDKVRVRHGPFCRVRVFSPVSVDGNCGTRKFFTT